MRQVNKPSLGSVGNLLQKTRLTGALVHLIDGQTFREMLRRPVQREDALHCPILSWTWLKFSTASNQHCFSIFHTVLFAHTNYPIITVLISATRDRARWNLFNSMAFIWHRWKAEIMLESTRQSTDTTNKKTVYKGSVETTSLLAACVYSAIICYCVYIYIYRKRGNPRV